MQILSKKNDTNTTNLWIGPSRRLAHVWIWVPNVLTVGKRDALLILSLTCLCLSWNPCWNRPEFHQVATPQIDQMFSSEPPSLLGCSSASRRLNPVPRCVNYYLLSVVNVQLFCSFRSLIESCMVKSPYSKFETCHELASNLFPLIKKNVTDDGKKALF